MSELAQGDAPRPAESRIEEASALERVDRFVVACPKDVTMYEDAIKTSGRAGQIRLCEVTELLLESLALAGGGDDATAQAADASPHEQGDGNHQPPEEGA